MKTTASPSPTPTLEPARDDHARRAAHTYSAAADHYRHPALAFWDRFGAETVSRMGLAAGQTVLDLCCGAGASAIPAACAVGPAGNVLAVDVAAPLLELARGRAAGEGLANLEFRLGDATATGLPDRSFDAVACVFGVFFAADTTAFVSEMWRLLRPGGVLAITTWGPGWADPLSTIFWDCIRELEPSLYKAFNPWDEITTAGALGQLLARAGVSGAATEALTGQQPLEHPDHGWEVVLGSGLRGTLDALAPRQRDTLREHVLTELRSNDVKSIRTDVVLGRAIRNSHPPIHPGGSPGWIGRR